MASRLRRFATGLTIDRTLALVLLTLLLGWAVSRPIGDPDLGWHLKAGEWIWRHGALPRSDPFGYPTAGVGWLPYSWLAELVFWGVTAGAGAHVLIIGCGLLFAGTFAIVYQTSRGQGAAPAVAAAVTLLAALSALPYFAQRPVADRKSVV